MTVIEGCTVVTIGGFHEAGDDELVQLEESLRRSELTLQIHRLSPGALVDPEAATSPDQALWVGWRSANAPGTLAQLLRILQAPMGADYNITYVVSRMVEGGRLNAGRLRAVPSDRRTLADRRQELSDIVSSTGLAAPFMIDVQFDEGNLQHRTGGLRIR